MIPLEPAAPLALPTQDEVADAITTMLDTLGYFAPVAGNASAESEDRARRDAIALLVARNLPGRITRQVSW